MNEVRNLAIETLRLARNLELVAKANEMQQTANDIRLSIRILETLVLRESEDEVEGVPI